MTQRFQVHSRTAVAVPDVAGLTSLDAALAYAEAGFFVGPLRPSDKKPGSVLGSRWQEKTSKEERTIRRWYKGAPSRGVFLHVGRSGLVVFDLDQDHLAALPTEIADALRTGPFQRSRGESDRGHYLFKTEERFGNSPGAFAPWGDVRGENGVIVLAPSLHPDTGRSYEWVRPGAVPDLPLVLRELLSRQVLSTRPAFSNEQLSDFISKNTEASNLARLSEHLERFLVRTGAGESRHGAMGSTLIAALRDAEDGLFPARRALDELSAAYARSFEVQRDGARAAPAAREFDLMAAWAAAQPRSEELADELWTQTIELRTVRRWARERMISPWSLLAYGLLLSLCAVPASHHLPALIAGSAPPNLFLALVGPSGSGKGSTERVGGELFKLPEEVKLDVVFGKPGSGEGIPKLFGDYDSGTGKASELLFRYSRAMISTLEVDTLQAMLGRDSSTLSAALREAWSGERLGASYATRTKKILVGEGTYRLCWSIGVQPARAEPLFAEKDGGLPQRFIWASVVDATAELPSGDIAALEPIILPRFDDEAPDWHKIMQSPLSAEDIVELEVPSFVREQVQHARYATLRGQHTDLDGHRLLLMEKVALAFAVLHGHTHGFDAEHWHMAEKFMLHSDKVREETERELAAARAEERDARAKSAGKADTVRSDAAHEATVTKAQGRVRVVLAKDGGWVSASALARQCSKPQKAGLADALRVLIERDEIEKKKSRSGETPGYSYRLKGSS